MNFQFMKGRTKGGMKNIYMLKIDATAYIFITLVAIQKTLGDLLIVF